jgi:hypothetical protein
LRPEPGLLVGTLSTKVTLLSNVSVTRLGKFLPFWQKFLALGDFFQGKNCPMIWAKFQLNKIGWGIVWAIFVVIG